VEDRGRGEEMKEEDEEADWKGHMRLRKVK